MNPFNKKSIYYLTALSLFSFASLVYAQDILKTDINNNNNIVQHLSKNNCYEEAIKAKQKGQNQLATLFFMNGMSKGNESLKCFKGYRDILEESIKSSDDINEIENVYTSLINIASELAKNVSVDEIVDLNNIINDLNNKKISKISSVIKANQSYKTDFSSLQVKIDEAISKAKKESTKLYKEKIDNNCISKIDNLINSLSTVIIELEEFHVDETLKRIIEEAKVLLEKLNFERNICLSINQINETITRIKTETNIDVKRSLMIWIDNSFASLFLAIDRVDSNLKENILNLCERFKIDSLTFQEEYDKSLLAPLNIKFISIENKIKEKLTGIHIKDNLSTEGKERKFELEKIGKQVTINKLKGELNYYKKVNNIDFSTYTQISYIIRRKDELENLNRLEFQKIKPDHTKRKERNEELEKLGAEFRKLYGKLGLETYNKYEVCYKKENKIRELETELNNLSSDSKDNNSTIVINIDNEKTVHQINNKKKNSNNILYSDIINDLHELVKEVSELNISRKSMDKFVLKCNEKIIQCETDRLSNYNKWALSEIKSVYKDIKDHLNNGKPGVIDEIINELNHYANKNEMAKKIFDGLMKKLDYKEEDKEKVNVWNKEHIKNITPLGQINIQLLNYKNAQCYQEVYSYGMGELKKEYRVPATFDLQSIKQKELTDF